MFRHILLLGILLTSACAQAGSERPYLFVWAGDDAKKSEDFLAVIDADPKSKSYGQTVASATVPGPSGTPHHTELVMAPGGHLLANQHESGRTVVFDVRDPLHPRVLHSYGDLAGYAHPHTYVREGKNILATFQYRGAAHMAGHKMPASPGGVVRFSESGKVIKSGSADDPAARNELIRPYSLVALPKLDRLLTTNTSMHFPDEGVSRTIQVWRLHDLKLLKTIALPAEANGKGNELPGEPVLAADGKSVLVHTFTCGLYDVTGLDQPEPKLHQLRTFGGKFCGVPLRIGHYWIATLFDEHAIAAYDLSTPELKEVSRITLDEEQKPHWISPDATGKRIVLNSGEYGDHRLFIVDFDQEAGSLKVDESFRDPGSNRPGVSMDGKKWGYAYPHGAVFSRSDFRR